MKRPTVEIIGRKEVEASGTYVDGRAMIKCCVELRCKSMYYSGVERPGLLHDSSQMLYWCNRTQEGIGCDDGDVSPQDCQPGRRCCQM